jgi:hypothetical protein
VPGTSGAGKLTNLALLEEGRKRLRIHDGRYAEINGMGYQEERCIIERKGGILLECTKTRDTRRIGDDLGGGVQSRR